MAELDEILAGREPASNETPAVNEQPTETVSAEPEGNQPEGEVETVRDSNGVPVAALQKEREKVRRYTEEVADMRRQMAESDAKWQQRFEQLVGTIRPPQTQQPEKPVEFWDDPEGLVKTEVERVREEARRAIMATREENSRMFAEEKYGAEAVKEAYQALASMKDSPDFEPTYRRIMSSSHPYGALVEWNKKAQVLAKIGDDPEAFIEAEVARRMAEAQASGGGQPAARAPAAAMPSNFATARNVGSRTGPAWSGPTPLTDIFKR